MEIVIYPEKFSDNITIEITTVSEDHCIIMLSNQAGSILRMMGVNILQGKNEIHFDNVKMLEAGTYQISIKNTTSKILYCSMLTKF
jgi:hypothetical protein